VEIQYGSTVTLHFTLRLVEEDILVDSTEGEEPMTIAMGDGDLVEGMETPLLGLKTGDMRRFEILAEDAFGPVEIDEDNLQNIPMSEFPEELEISPGQVLGFTSPSGDEIPGTIMGFTEDIVTVNFGHPLAGHDLVFEVEIVDVKPPN
jgi:FKBP-type peptidyl-prolyl cis-trans isomerase SlpA